MQFILKLIVILFLTANNIYASFEVRPLKLQINLQRKFAELYINNNSTQNQKFYLELRDCVSKNPINDLSFSPKKFSLQPNKSQTVRIALKHGLDYVDKQYILVIKTDEINKVGTLGIKVPITINNNIIDDFTRKGKATPDLDEEAISPSGGLTHIKISVPVTATVND